jgi:uncharacterized membrane protein YqjE
MLTKRQWINVAGYVLGWIVTIVVDAFLTVLIAFGVMSLFVVVGVVFDLAFPYQTILAVTVAIVFTGLLFWSQLNKVVTRLMEKKPEEGTGEEPL